jgi:hypothetical protein
VPLKPSTIGRKDLKQEIVDVFVRSAQIRTAAAFLAPSPFSLAPPQISVTENNCEENSQMNTHDMFIVGR